MFLLILLVFPLVGIIQGSTRVSESDLKAASFAKAIKDKKLNGKILREFEVVSEMSCQFECISEDRCLSYNFFPIHGKKTSRCQLSGSDRFADQLNFTKEDGTLHRGVQLTELSNVAKETLYTKSKLIGVCESEHKKSPSVDIRGRERKYAKQPHVYCNETKMSPVRNTCEEDDLCKEDLNFKFKFEICLADYKSKTRFFTCVKDHAKNCLKYFPHGFTTDGVHWISPDEEEPFQVLCDMSTDVGGWTTFQKRMDGSVDFFVDWESYKKGFGNLEGEFWLGNDYLHRLTTSVNMMVRFDMEDYEGDRRFAEYTTFSVADESDDYRVTIDGYRGTAGDSLTRSDQMPIRYMKFTTKDRDNDVRVNVNCALDYRGGWWYKACHGANPNGLYRGRGHAQGVIWLLFRGYDYSSRRFEIRLRPV